jgi:DNA-binding transcriptional regulator YdaS (Cro superfamily)
MHPLEKYLRAKKESTNAFAKRAGLEQSTLWRIIKCRQTPRAKTAEAIELATNGEVTRLQLLYPKGNSASSQYLCSLAK